MRLLKISVKGLELFHGKAEVDFFAEKRVYADNCEMVYRTFGNIFTNNVISIVGINAAGKTSLLKLISFVLAILNGKSINSIGSRDILTESKEVRMEVLFYDKKYGVCKLYSIIKKALINEVEERYIFSEESLWSKKISKIKSKKDFMNFEESTLLKQRDNNAEFLQDDTSIAMSISKNNQINIHDFIMDTNINLLRLLGNFPQELIAFLDPNIESITFDRDRNEAKIKFYGKESIPVSNPLAVLNYLSSGTVKGLNIFVSAMLVFEEGGYLIVDELENHFNREIVATLVRFFMNKDVNKSGATLVFSTHYSELLDEFERTDNIYIVRNRKGITIQKLCSTLKRNDIKKSDAFKSDFLEGTVPTYDSYIALKNIIIRGHIQEA